MRSRWLAGLLLLGLLIAFRCLGAVFTEQLPNFNPLVALLVCSVVFLRGRMAWGLPVAAWILSNPLASWLQGFAPFGHWGPVLTALATLALIGLAALPLRRRAQVPTLLLGSVVAALLFHAVTGLAAWLADPRYAKTGLGLYQALWAGLPADALPTWVFLRNLAAANLAFTALFLLARPARTAAQAPAGLLSPTR